MEFLVNLKNGLISQKTRNEINKYLSKKKDGYYSFKIKTLDKRSGAQNKLYWVVVGVLADEMGYKDPEELHEILKLELNPKEIHHKQTDQYITVGGSTTKMTKEEFSSYLFDVYEFAYEFYPGINLPELIFDA